MLKYASNVIEKCLEFQDDQVFEIFVFNIVCFCIHTQLNDKMDAIQESIKELANRY